MKCSFQREQRHYCGPTKSTANYLEVDIFPVTTREHRASNRAKKRKASSLIQANLNQKNSRRHFVQLINTNFTEDDLHVTLSYLIRTLPKNDADARRDLDNYIRRVNYARQKLELPQLKYIAVTEWEDPEDGGDGVQIHHHIIMSGGCGKMFRSQLETLWTRGRGKQKKRLGSTTIEHLRFDKDSLARLASYLRSHPERERRWKQSQGLHQPQRPRPNDSRFSRCKVATMARERVDDSDFWAEKYPGWELNDAADVNYNEHTGWSIYLKLRRIRPVRRKE